VGHLRLCMGVQVRPGNETSGSFGLEPLTQWLERTPGDRWPEFVRGDIGYGTQTWMLELEARGLGYLFKLRQTKNVKELIALCELKSEWASAPGNWQHCESRLQLTGWERSRRVVVYRCAHRRKAKPDKRTKALPGTCVQGELAELELLAEDDLSYEYAIYIKLVDPLVAREAITSRPMYLMHTAKASTHQSVRTLVIFCAHSQAREIRRNLEQAAERLKSWASRTTEQFKKASVWSHVIAHILLHHQTIGAGNTRGPPLLGTAQ